MKEKLVLAAIVLMGTGFPSMAATITVTTTDTSIANDGQCSLPEAIINFLNRYGGGKFDRL